MTNKKFKMAAMSLALTACVATAPLAANAKRRRRPLTLVCLLRRNTLRPRRQKLP